MAAEAGSSRSHLDDMHALSKSHLAALRDARAALLDQQESTQAAAADAQRHARAAAEAQQRVIELQGQLRALVGGAAGGSSDSSAIAAPLMEHIRQLPPLPAYMQGGAFGPVPQDLPEPLEEGAPPAPPRAADVVAAVHTLCQHYTFALQAVSLLFIRLRKAEQSGNMGASVVPGGGMTPGRAPQSPAAQLGDSLAQGAQRNTPLGTQLEHLSQTMSSSSPGSSLRRLRPGVSPRVSALLGKVYEDADEAAEGGGGAGGRGASPGRQRAMQGGALELQDALAALELTQMEARSLRSNLAIAEAERTEALVEAEHAREQATLAAAQVDDAQQELVALRRTASELAEALADARGQWARREAQLEDEIAQTQLTLLQRQAEATEAAAAAAGESVTQGRLRQELQAMYGSPAQGGAGGLNDSGVSACDVHVLAPGREHSEAEGRTIGQLQGALGEANGHMQALSEQLVAMQNTSQNKEPAAADMLTLKVHDLTSHLLGLQRGMEKLARRTRRLQLQQTSTAKMEQALKQEHKHTALEPQEGSPTRPPSVHRVGSPPRPAARPPAPPQFRLVSASRPPRHGTRVWSTPLSHSRQGTVEASSPALSRNTPGKGPSATAPLEVDSVSITGGGSDLNASADSVQALLQSNDRLVAALGEVKNDFASVMGVVRGGSNPVQGGGRSSPPRNGGGDINASLPSQGSAGVAPWAIAMQLAATRAAAAETSAVLSAAKDRGGLSVAGDGESLDGGDSMSLRRSITAPSVRPVGAAAERSAPKPVRGGLTPAHSERSDTGRDFSDQDMTPPPAGTPARLRLVAAGPSSPAPAAVAPVPAPVAVPAAAPVPGSRGGGGNPAFRGFMPAPVLPPPGMSRGVEAPPSRYQQAPPRGFRVRVSPMLATGDHGEHDSPGGM